MCKKKNLKSIDFMREKIKAKNLKYKFYRFDKEKNIELFTNGGWHFNNLLSPENISKKLKNTNAWQNQAIQRDYIIKKLNFAEDNDFIFFSDPDEILNPEVLKNFDLKKKYGIFLQRFFNYKFNIFILIGKWLSVDGKGTKVCRKKKVIMQKMKSSLILCVKK